MADYRKSLMDMTPEERADVAPGFVPSDDVSTPLSVKVADEAISLATPIDSIVEIQEELAKDEPDYLKIGMLGGMEAIGLLAPGAGKAAQSMIRKGADMARQTDNVVDVASNIPQVPRSVTPTIDTTKSSVEAAGLTDEAIDAWRESNATSPEFRKALKGRNEELMDLAAGVKEGRVFNTTYWKRADELRPIRKVTEVPKPATVQDTVSALDKGKRKSPIVGLNYDIPDGEKITARLDIPAYVDYDVWIPTLRHSGKTMYKPALRMKNVKFIQPEGRESGMALDVAVGPQRLQDEFGLADKKAKAKGNKSPFAVMEGEYVKATDDEAYEYATSIFDSDEWTQAGYDPSKRGFFYDRETGEAILSGDEVVQVGHLVLVKNAEKVNPEVFGFSEGGMAMNEQMDAVFKSSRAGYAEGGEVGAAPDTTIGVDPVSGNEVPMGATPEEVRDDIPAQLSEGEYVVPADVVRFYGVKFFEDLRTEAKQGYAEMDQNGRIGGEPVGPEGMEMIEPEDDLPFDISELQMIDDEVEMAEGGYLDRAINRDKPYNRFESLLQFLFKDKDEYGETPIDRYREQMDDDDMGFFESFMGNNFERGERKYGKKGYAEGGEVDGSAPYISNAFDPFGGSGGFEIREYLNDAGEVMYIQFMNGQPMTFIPQGFRPKASASEQAATGAGVAASSAAPTSPSALSVGTSSSDSGDNSIGDTGMSDVDSAFTEGASARENWMNASLDDITKNAANLGYSNSLVSTALGAVSGPLGIAAGVGMGNASRKKAYDMLDGIAYQIETLNANPDQNATKIKQLVDQQKVIQQYLEPSSKSASPATSLLKGSNIFGGATSLYENLGDFGGADGKPDGRRTFGDTWLGDLLGFDGKAGIQATDANGELLTLSRSLDGARRGATDWEDLGSAERAKERAKEREEARKDTPYQKALTAAQKAEAAGNTQAAQQSYGQAASAAQSSWVAATNAANSIKDKSSADFHKAIKAQSEASKAFTKAKQKETGRSGFFG